VPLFATGGVPGEVYNQVPGNRLPGNYETYQPSAGLELFCIFLARLEGPIVAVLETVDGSNGGIIAGVYSCQAQVHIEDKI